MHFKENVEVECKEALRLKSLLNESLGVDLTELLNCKLYCVSRGNSKTIYCIDSKLENFTREKSLLENVVHLGILVGTSNTTGLKPSIHLALILSTYKSKLRKGMVILYGGAALRFIHGKPVSKGFEVLGSSKMYLVLNEKGDPLGWGYIAKCTLHPIIDIGWFLREGG